MSDPANTVDDTGNTRDTLTEDTRSVDSGRDETAPAPPADMDLVDTPPPTDNKATPPIVQQHRLIRPAVKHNTVGPLFPSPGDNTIAPVIDPAQNINNGGTHTSYDDSDGGGGYDDSDGGIGPQYRQPRQRGQHDR